MSAGKKTRNTAEKLAGKAKEATGKISDDPSKTGHGQRKQTKSDLKQAGQKAKDAFKH